MLLAKLKDDVLVKLREISRKEVNNSRFSLEKDRMFRAVENASTIAELFEILRKGFYEWQFVSDSLCRILDLCSEDLWQFCYAMLVNPIVVFDEEWIDQ